MFLVERRDADTLLSLIKGHVNQGSTVYTDGWAAYEDLSRRGYTHYVIEHKKAFSWQCKDKSTGELKTVKHILRIHNGGPTYCVVM